MNCLFCSKEIKKGNKYCNNTCQAEYQAKSYIAKWKAGQVSGLSKNKAVSNHIRNFLFKKYDNKCCYCDWNQVNNYTKNIPLEVDHVDGDYKNNKEENLRLLCPNCHSLTPTYKGANKGGRDRTKYKSRY